MGGGRKKNTDGSQFEFKRMARPTGREFVLKDESLHSRNNNCSLLTRLVAWVLMDKKYRTHSRFSKEDRNTTITAKFKELPNTGVLKLSSSGPGLAALVAKLTRFAEMLAS